MRHFQRLMCTLFGGCLLIDLLAGAALCAGWRGEAADKNPTKAQHVLIYGDAGDGGSTAYRVAASMAQRHQQLRFDYAVSMGDNFYGPADEESFSRVFEQPYRDLISTGVVFYQGLGNHDMEYRNLAAELNYSQRVDALRRGTGGWVLPAEDYVVERPFARWVFVNASQANNSVHLPPERLLFAERELCRSSSGWKFLVVHYPFWSTGVHGDNQQVQAKLLPIVERCGVDIVFSGHDHHAEMLLPWQGTFFVVSGNGKESRTFQRKSANESLFALRKPGFAELVFDEGVARLAFFDSNTHEVHATTIQRRIPFWCDTWKQESNTVLGRIKLDSTDDVSRVIAEVGFSATPADPVLQTNSFRFFPANYDATASDVNGLYAFRAVVPDTPVGSSAVFRYKLNEDSAWIYGDLSAGPGLHGNYDGIQTNRLLRLR